MTDRHNSTEHLRHLLVPNPNLPPPLHSIAVQVQIFSEEIVSRLGDGPELTTGLRKLLEAKDCFVRQALIDMGEQEPKRDEDA
jgi:hypothetical protein